MSDHTTATEQAVLATLAGTPPAQAAADAGLEPAELADAIRIYRAAGQAALRQPAAPQEWLQIGRTPHGMFGQHFCQEPDGRGKVDSGVLGGSPRCLVQAGPAVAQAWVGELVKPARVGQATVERGLGDPLACRVAEGDSGQLLRPRQPGGAVAPRWP